MSVCVLSDSSSLTAASEDSTVAEKYSGVFRLRLPHQGKYSVFIMNTRTMQVLSSVHRVSVKLCGDSIVPDDVTVRDKFDNTVEEKSPPRPLLRHSGVLALSGHHSVLVPHSVLPPLSSSGGSFSVSFWTRLLDEPTGSFRAFFYKGNGVDANRTPSVWLLPTCNRLALRVTTVDSPDLGADTTLSIPLNQWSHVCIVFDNQTRSEAGGGYTITVYIDGQLDVSLRYSTEVIPNNSSLQLFKDVSFDGPRGFVADLNVWGNVLSHSQVKSLASGSASSSYHRWTQPVDLALDLMDGLGTRNDDDGDEVSSSDSKSSEDDNEDSALLLSENNFFDFDLLLDSLPVPSSTPATSAPLQYLLKEIESAVEGCHAPGIRLDLYAEAASLGNCCWC